MVFVLFTRRGAWNPESFAENKKAPELIIPGLFTNLKISNYLCSAGAAAGASAAAGVASAAGAAASVVAGAAAGASAAGAVSSAFFVQADARVIAMIAIRSDFILHSFHE
jgi:hypothetical protein